MLLNNFVNFVIMYVNYKLAITINAFDIISN
jgi:hypothetical protein